MGNQCLSIIKLTLLFYERLLQMEWKDPSLHGRLQNIFFQLKRNVEKSSLKQVRIFLRLEQNTKPWSRTPATAKNIHFFLEISLNSFIVWFDRWFLSLHSQCIWSDRSWFIWLDRWYLLGHKRWVSFDRLHGLKLSLKHGHFREMSTLDSDVPCSTTYKGAPCFNKYREYL